MMDVARASYTEAKLVDPRLSKWNRLAPLITSDAKQQSNGLRDVRSHGEVADAEMERRWFLVGSKVVRSSDTVVQSSRNDA